MANDPSDPPAISPHLLQELRALSEILMCLHCRSSMKLVVGRVGPYLAAHVCTTCGTAYPADGGRALALRENWVYFCPRCETVLKGSSHTLECKGCTFVREVDGEQLFTLALTMGECPGCEGNLETTYGHAQLAIRCLACGFAAHTADRVMIQRLTEQAMSIEWPG